jgi:NAD(P)-dependent dehydrogenase (short-subunit alcohol dehydrogenase family)
VTGGGRGLGRAIALALGREGADVALSYHGSRDGAQSAANELAAAGRRVHLAAADATAPGAIGRFVNDAAAALGGIDVLVNNAGIAAHQESFSAPPEVFDDIFAVNVRGVWDLSVAAARVMREQGGGNIVNLGSISALIVNRPQLQAAYNASKAAVHQLTKSLAAEWAPYGIRVNAIAPGYVKTVITPVDRPEFRRMWIEDAPQQRYATPDEIAPALIYLASDASTFVTGSILVIDGGYTIY